MQLAEWPRLACLPVPCWAGGGVVGHSAAFVAADLRHHPLAHRNQHWLVIRAFKQGWLRWWWP